MQFSYLGRKNVTVQENVKIQFLTDFHTYSAVTKLSQEEGECIPVEMIQAETSAPSLGQEATPSSQLGASKHMHVVQDRQSRWS